MQTTHPSSQRGASQALLILGRLSATPGEWVSLVDLWQVSGSMAVHSRINDLRQNGYEIEHRNQRPKGEGHRIHSFYRLIPG